MISATLIEWSTADGLRLLVAVVVAAGLIAMIAYGTGRAHGELLAARRLMDAAERRRKRCGSNPLEQWLDEPIDWAPFERIGAKDVEE